MRHRTRTVLTLLAVLTTGPAGLADLPGGVWVVDGDAPVDGDGTSWTTPRNNLRLALGQVDPAVIQQIWVKSTTSGYRPSTTAADESFVIPAGIAVYGGFAGVEDLRSERNLRLNPTVLDGAGFSYQVVRVEDEIDADRRLDGFTITGGDSSTEDASVTQRLGAGVSIGDVGMQLVNCRIEGNQAGLCDEGDCDGPGDVCIAQGAGGGVSIDLSSSGVVTTTVDALVANCFVSGNVAGGLFYTTAPSGGGGVYVTGAPGTTVDLVNCVVAGNTISARCDFEHDDPDGAGIKIVGNSGTHVRVVSCTVADNRALNVVDGAEASGGGIFVQSPTIDPEDDPEVEIYNTILWGNESEATSTCSQQMAGDLSSTVLAFCDIEGNGSDPAYTCFSPIANAALLDCNPQFRIDYSIDADSCVVDAGATEVPGHGSLIIEDIVNVDDDDPNADSYAFTEPVPPASPPDHMQGDEDVWDTRISTAPGGSPCLIDIGAFEHQFTCPADIAIPADAVVGFADLLVVLSRWGDCPGDPPDPGCPGDIDLDGVVGFSDLLEVLGSWGPCGCDDYGAPPQSVIDCMSRYPSDPSAMAKCIEAMLLAGTP